MTAKVAKVENYSAEQTKAVVGMYEGGKGQTVETIAEMVGKSVRSVIAKLAREGVYVAKSGKTAKGRVTKADLVKRIEVALGLTDMGTLEKASHEALEALSAKVEKLEDTLAALNAAVDQREYEALE